MEDISLSTYSMNRVTMVTPVTANIDGAFHVTHYVTRYTAR